MDSILDFIGAALPWVSIGLSLVFIFGRENARTKERQNSRLFNYLSWVPVLLLLISAAFEIKRGDLNSATTWVLLALGNGFISFNGTRKAWESSDIKSDE